MLDHLTKQKLLALRSESLEIYSKMEPYLRCLDSLSRLDKPPKKLTELINRFQEINEEIACIVSKPRKGNRAN